MLELFETYQIVWNEACRKFQKATNVVWKMRLTFLIMVHRSHYCAIALRAIPFHNATWQYHPDYRIMLKSLRYGRPGRSYCAYSMTVQ